MTIPSTVWRGEPVSRLNDNEFQDGMVQNAEVDIFDVDGDPDELEVDSRQAHFGTDVYDLPGEVSKRSVAMTPGFTHNQGTAYHFANYDREEPGVMLGFQSAPLPNLFSVEYTYDFMDDHEGVLGRVETLADGEVRLDGELVGLTKEGDVRNWADDVESRATSPTYEDEAEIITYEESVPIEPALHTIVCPVAKNGASNAKAQSRLAYYDGFEVAYGRGTKTSYLDDEELVEHLWEQVADQMDDYADDLVVLMVDEDRGVRKTSDFTSDNFLLGYWKGGLITEWDDPIFSYPGGQLITRG